MLSGSAAASSPASPSARHRSRSNRVGSASTAAQPLRGQLVGEDRPGQAGELLLRLGGGEVHLAHRAPIGSRSPTAAMMSRCTSFVPPPKVRMSDERCIRSTRPCSSAAGEPGRTTALAPSTSISSR